MQHPFKMRVWRDAYKNILEKRAYLGLSKKQAAVAVRLLEVTCQDGDAKVRKVKSLRSIALIRKVVPKVPRQDAEWTETNLRRPSQGGRE